MTHGVMRYLVLPILLGLILAAAARSAEQKLTVDGMEVFYGIVPAEIVKQQADRDGSAMHDGRVRKSVRHLVVALFDAQSGQRLSDATIDAVVSPLGLSPQKKRLETMRINETITHDDFFEFSAESAPFHVDLRITRPEPSRPQRRI